MGDGAKWKWSGECDGEPWWLEIESDCFTEGEPFVVSIWLEYDDGSTCRRTDALATPSPQEAREMASALVAAAGLADAANKRVKKNNPVSGSVVGLSGKEETE